jgi:thiamine biosynthesis lipoprotein
MGSDAHVIVVGGPIGLADSAQRRIDELERRWSRFLDDSEISNLNRKAGTFVEVSADTATLIQRAVDAWRLTGGAFDPTVLGAVIRAGYHRSFDQLGPTPEPGASPLGIGAEHIAFAGSTACVPVGVGFDPGGIGKGLAADMMCAELMEAGADGACVNLGGDVAVAGIGPDGDGCGYGWTVAVEYPGRAEPLGMIGLAQGAVATTSSLRRTWHSDGEARHHLIDPQIGRPSDSDVVLAAVVATDAWLAEVLAKAVLLAGAAHPFDILGGTGAEALAVDDHGRVMASSNLGAYLGGAVLPRTIGGAPMFSGHSPAVLSLR